MAKEIIWTKRANTKLNTIIAFLLEEWGENVTSKFLTKTFTILELLSENPQLGSVEKPGENIRGFLITKHNKLFYRVTENAIILLNIFDTRSEKKKY